MKKLIVIFVLLSLLFSSCSSVPAWKKEFKKGVGMHKLQKYDEAISFFKKALDLNEHYEKAAFNIATIYYQRKDLDNAVEYLKKTLKINRRNKKARYILSTIYFNKGDYQETYNSLLQTKGEQATSFFRKFVKTLVNEGYNFKGDISLAKDHKIKKYDSGKNKWTEWNESTITFELDYARSGKTTMRQLTNFTSANEEMSEHAEKLVKDLKLSKNESKNPKELKFRIKGELLIDPIETKVTLYQKTFEQIMDSNLLVVAEPDTGSCWTSEMMSTSFSGEIETELTINPDGTVKEWKTVDRYKAKKTIAECVGKKLAEVKFINFPDSGERKLTVHSTRMSFYNFF